MPGVSAFRRGLYWTPPRFTQRRRIRAMILALFFAVCSVALASACTRPWLQALSELRMLDRYSRAIRHSFVDRLRDWLGANLLWHRRLPASMQTQVSPCAFRSRRVRQDGRVSCDCDRVVVRPNGFQGIPADARLFPYTSYLRLREEPSYAWYGMAGWKLTSETDEVGPWPPLGDAWPVEISERGGTGGRSSTDTWLSSFRDGAQRRATRNSHAPVFFREAGPTESRASATLPALESIIDRYVQRAR